MQSHSWIPGGPSLAGPDGTHPDARPGGETFLSEYGLLLAFLLAISAGSFMAIQVVKVALAPTQSDADELERARRCRKRQVEAVNRLPQGLLALVPDDVDEYPLTRGEMVQLSKEGLMQGVLTCPGQGPLRDPDTHHLEVRTHEEPDGWVAELHCREHGRVVPPPEDPGVASAED